jgi:amino acid transporter
MGAVTLLLALAFPLTELAKATSAIILLVFAAVNLTLWRVKRRDPDREGEGPRYPPWLPLTGGLSCLAVPAFQLSQLF